MKKNIHKTKGIRITIYIISILVSLFFLSANSKNSYAGCTTYCAGACTQNWPFSFPSTCNDDAYMGCDGGGWNGCCLIGQTCTWTASFAGNGGTCTPTSRGPVSAGSSVLGSTCTRSGYNFNNFTISPSSGACIGFNTSTGACGNIQGDFTATAQWLLANSAPTAPTSLLTEGATNPTGVTDTTPEFSAIYNDPNSGDIANNFEIEVNTNSTFTGTVMWDTGKTAMSNLTAGNRVPDKSYAGTALSLNGTIYYWRIRFWDDDGALGAWSAVANFTMNTAPTAPTSLLAEGATNPTGVTDTTPEFSAIFNDPNTGQTGTQYRIEVNTLNTFAGTVMWDSGTVAMTATAIGARSPDISYAGTALSLNGTTYYWRIRFTDNVGTIGAVSATAQFTMNVPPNAPTTPYCNGLTNPTDVTTANPIFSAVFSDLDTSDTGNWYEIEVNTQTDFLGTVKWDTGVLSMTATTNGTRSPNFTYAGTSLGWSGTTYYWRIKFGDNNGGMSGWSATQNFVMHSNSAPTAPTSLLTEGATNPTEVIDLTPEFSAIFNDANTGDTAVQYEIEVNTNNAFTGTVMWDSDLTGMTAIAIGARSSDVSYNGTALSLNGATYYWRIRFVDNYGGVGTWSATAQFTMNNLPYATDLTTETLTDPIKIYDTTPEFSARFNDADAGSTGIHYQINVNTTSAFNGTSMWDSTKLSMTAVPTGSLITDKSYAGTALSLNGAQYFWRIMFWDENNSGGGWSSTANFRMSGPPDAPTLLLTDDNINPLYLSSVTPIFSAIYTDINNDNSASYEIEVNTTNLFNGTVMWDTGKLATTITSGNRSPNYTYSGTALPGTSNITYYWRIRFWDIDDNVSAWSSVNTFRDSLLHFYLNGLKLNGIRLD